MRLSNQEGQASVFVLILIGVVIISVIFLFQAGRLTTEKMQVQNAADAAAFGAATLEARSLNFSAYTNRAMAANEVAIGQMIGLLSFVDELKTTGEYIDEYAAGLEAATAWLFAILVVGDVIESIISALVATMEDIGTTITEVGEDVEKTMETIASPAIKGFSIINAVYSYSQEIYHLATIYLVTSTILKSVEDNVPGTPPMDIHHPLDMLDANKPGAHLSDFGMLALIGHLPSYLYTYTKRYSPSKQKKEKGKSAKEKEQEKKDQELLTKDEQRIAQDRKDIARYQKHLGKARQQRDKDKKLLAKDLKQQKKDKKEHDALLEKWNKDHDPETKKELAQSTERLRDDKLRIRDDKAAVQEDQNKIDTIQHRLTAAEDKLQRDKKRLGTDEKKQADDEKKWDKQHHQGKEENEGMQRMAATIREARDPFTSGGPPIYDKNIYNLKFKFGNRDWKFGYGFDLNLHVGKIHFGHLKFFTGLDSKGGSELRFKGKNYVWSGVDTSVLEAELDILGTPIELAIPTGGGGYQAGSSAEPENILTPLDMPPTLGDYGKPKTYGGAGYPYGRWPAWEGASLELAENDVEGTPYGGLRPYRDMSKMDLPKKKKLLSNPFDAPFFLVGVIRKFDDIHKDDPKFSDEMNLLDDNPKNNRMGAIAKSELFFNRPRDLSYFWRADKKIEKPNVFSPFWKARLAKTTDLERFLAMAIQHNTIWLAKKDAGQIPALEGIKEKLDKILKSLNDFL